MAAVSFSSVLLRPPEFSATTSNNRKSAAIPPRRRNFSHSPKPGDAVNRARAVSGEKLLRNIMLDDKIELYATYIISGKDLLNERANAELRYLKKVVVQRLPQWK